MQILKDEVKTEIDRAALQIFLEKEYRGASMKEIARKAGTSVSNIYNYYPSKLALFSSLVHPALESIHRLLGSLIETEGNHSFADEKFRRGFEGILIDTISPVLNLRRETLLLLYDKSAGTPFESSREEVVEFIAGHFIDSLSEMKKNRETLLLMHILASNLTEGILEIVRHTRHERERASVLRGLIRYHVSGIYQFYETE